MMRTRIVLLHIWRPEATDDPDNPHSGPFDGVESYIMASEEAAATLANELHDKHPSWRFHIDQATPWVHQYGEGEYAS